MNKWCLLFAGVLILALTAFATDSFIPTVNNWTTVSVDIAKIEITGYGVCAKFNSTNGDWWIYYSDDNDISKGQLMSAVLLKLKCESKQVKLYYVGDGGGYHRFSSISVE